MNNTTEFNSLLLELTEVAGNLWQRGWAEANGGNLSVALDHSTLFDVNSDQAKTTPLPESFPELAGLHFLITGTGKRFRDLARDPARCCCVLKIDENGNNYRVVWGSTADLNFRPTSELASHLSLHREIARIGSGENCVLHTHPDNLIALSHFEEFADEAKLNNTLWSIMPEVKVLLPQGIAFVPYQLPGSTELGRATAQALNGNKRVMLWEKHGCLAVTDSLNSAFDLIETAEKAAGIILKCLSCGRTPQGLSGEQLKGIIKKFGL
jgi:rhamnulose-1-phosphate aldolase